MTATEYTEQMKALYRAELARVLAMGWEYHEWHPHMAAFGEAQSREFQAWLFAMPACPSFLSRLSHRISSLFRRIPPTPSEGR
jgi:hypothetical protein